MGRRARTWLRFLRRVVLISVGAVLVMAAIGFALGGWAGAQGGAMWGLVAGAMAVPGMLLGIALNAGESMHDDRDSAAERRYLDGHS